MSAVGELEAALAHLPLMMTVEEAAEVLRVSRAHAYALARRYLETDGREGIPVLRVGHCLRVPRWALIELLSTGRLVRLHDAVDDDQLATDDHDAPPLKIRRSRRTSHQPTVTSIDRSARSAEQLTLLQSE